MEKDVGALLVGALKEEQGAYRPIIDPRAMRKSQGTGVSAPDPDKATALWSGEPPVATAQEPGREPSGLPRPPVGSTSTPDDAPYTDMHPSRALIDAPLYAQSPAYFQAQPPYDRDELMGESFVQRLQPPLGWSAGSYALNTEWDAGSPDEAPDTALPGLRDGAFRFSQRLKSQGDQGIVDNLLRQGGSYLSVNQPPYWGDDRPAGR